MWFISMRRPPGRTAPPITADDVAYTALRLASPMVNNTSMMYYVFEGVGDDGFVEEGAESIEGVQVIDEKNRTVYHEGAHGP